MESVAIVDEERRRAVEIDEQARSAEQHAPQEQPAEALVLIVGGHDHGADHRAVANELGMKHLQQQAVELPDFDGRPAVLIELCQLRLLVELMRGMWWRFRLMGLGC